MHSYLLNPYPIYTYCMCSRSMHALSHENHGEVKVFLIFIVQYFHYYDSVIQKTNHEGTWLYLLTATAGAECQDHTNTRSWLASFILTYLWMLPFTLLDNQLLILLIVPAIVSSLNFCVHSHRDYNETALLNLLSPFTFLAMNVVILPPF